MLRAMKKTIRNAIFTVIAALLLPTAAYAQKAPSIIRDTEIENTIKHWTAPVIRAAGLSPENINFIIVQDDNINAFVAGGPNIFIYTGLIQKSKSPDEIVGVVAHELGHIAGGHLLRTHDAMKSASYESILGTLLGIGAAVLTGEGRLAAAVAAGTQGMALNRFLAFSRAQESSADQAGLSFLEKAQMSPEGMVDFMRTLDSEELLPPSQQSEYMRTHPITRDRVDALAAGYERSAYKNNAMSTKAQDEYRLITAKLNAFLEPQRVAWDYKDTDHSIAADYARAIAAYRQNDVEKSLQLMNGLLERQPQNPYFLELKGQMLADFGKVEPALVAYKTAIEFEPEAPLIRIAYANALIETAGQNNGARLDEAISQLNRAARDESRSPRIFRLLATAHGKKGEEPMAKLALAEEALLKQQLDYAKQQAQSALNGLPSGSQAAQRARDILSHIEQNEKKD